MCSSDKVANAVTLLYSIMGSMELVEERVQVGTGPGDGDE